jgi:hypothetical protein
MKRGDDTIEIEGSLADKTIRLRATGNLAWGVALGAIGVAFFSAIRMRNSAAGPDLPTSAHAFTGGTAAVAGIGAVSVLGTEVTLMAVTLAIAAGGVGILGTIRGYREISSEKGRLVLQRR